MTANTKKSVPPMIPMTRSERYLATYDPPSTATPVATACAAMAPAATETGFCAADSAMVERKDRSPNSAANTSPKMLAIAPNPNLDPSLIACPSTASCASSNSSSRPDFPSPLSSMASASLSVLMPKNANANTAAISSSGNDPSAPRLGTA